MENLWNEQEAAQFAQDDITGLRVYTSQLLGRNPNLVLHGGGNTSVKAPWRDVFGEVSKALFVKGSGWDLRTIKAGGFAPVRLDYLQRLGALPALTDTEMMQHLRLALLDPAAPTPSVEAILHALLPFDYVDHTHADAVVAISNTPAGEETLRGIYGDRVLILPYVMPGFVLAQQVHEALAGADWQKLEGIILLHHGIITFSDDARTSYSRMIALVSEAENWLQKQGATTSVRADYQPQAPDYTALAALRARASEMMGAAMLLRWDHDPASVGFSALPHIDSLIRRGPLTPDHSIHTKPFAALFETDPLPGLERFCQDYRNYFDTHASGQQCLDLLPRVGIWRNRGIISLAPAAKRLAVVADIYQHTLQAIQWAEALGGWTTLPAQDQFDLEYWELEQAKLKSSQKRAEFEGKVVLVSGAAAGIGKACVEAFLAAGACVCALDIKPEITGLFTSDQVLGLVCDILDPAAVEMAVAAAVRNFGGIDVLVSNAGCFPASERLEQMSDARWAQSLDLNLSAHMRMLRHCIPLLRHGIDPAVVIIGSKNVPAPGPGAGAYSVAKAGLAQLGRIAALELAAEGVRVNTIHPNAVFDTELWTEELLQARAASYGLSPEAYRRNTLLGREVRSADVAAAAVLLAGRGFSRTTGAQIAVDGGNERVI